MDIIQYIREAVAFVALLASVYAVWMTTRFNKRQLSLIESQKKINKQLLDRGNREKLESQKASLGAEFIKSGHTGRYKLRIYNKGQASARNICIEFPEGNDVFINSDVKEKFPMEILEQDQSVELITVVVLGTKPKHMLLLKWADDFSDTNEKLVYPTIF